MRNDDYKEISRKIFLLAKHNREGLDDEEWKELQEWLQENEANRQLFQQVSDREKVREILASWQERDLDAPYRNLRSRLQDQVRKKRRKSWMAAAAVLLLVSVGSYGWYSMYRSHQLGALLAHDLRPPDSRTILHTGKYGTFHIGEQGISEQLFQNDVLIQMDNLSTISYRNLSGKPVPYGTLVFDTLYNPRGSSNFTLLLSDGSKIVLNTGTRIRFPELFSSTERFVELLDGEIYVEVAHDDKKPFRVKAPGYTIHDLGTSFNVSAYREDSIVTTTLTEGLVQIEKDSKYLKLVPGQKLAFDTRGTRTEISSANMDEALAWTTGLFHFEHADLPTVMNQIARWYDVEIVYKGKLPAMDINGEIYRNLNASQVLKGLEYLNIQFRIEGNKIMVEGR